ncbi:MULTISPECIES: DUF5681 domain-containing protein [Sphingobacterium]|uniref:DUF5681 domain-containing protein n=1 Tax=Sphingobacterium TaxID=28453 RepID=UPI0013DAD95E|nr:MULTISPECIES: DUF5681 domain-containing protein [unclassified Sphingobacterium]
MAGRQPQKANKTSIKKGVSGNPKGRPKGALNKTTARQKATIEMVMDSLAETIIEDLTQVNSSRRLQVYIDLMNYIKPKLSATKNETEVKQDTKIEVVFKPYKLNKGTNVDDAESDGN